MKRLKYACLFGGHQYPYYLCMCGIALPAFLLGTKRVTPSAAFGMMILLPFIVLAVCRLMIQRLRPEEAEKIAASVPPLWLPADAALLRDLHAQVPAFSTAAIVGISCAAALSPLSFIPDDQGNMHFSIFLICALAVVLILLLDGRRRNLWRQADETAAYAVIPIDHMYELTHFYRRSTRRVSYLVFYQPDGRYVLRAKPGSGGKDFIAVIQFRGSVFWMPHSGTVQTGSEN